MGGKQNFIGENFWAKGYYVSTAGGDEESIKKHIRVPCGQGKTGFFVFIYVFLAKCGVEIKFPLGLSEIFRHIERSIKGKGQKTYCNLSNNPVCSSMRGILCR
jgi:hypothetical protein